MGIFGLFVFLSVLVVVATWRSVKLAQLKQEVLLRMLEKGQAVSSDQLALLLGEPHEAPVNIGFKIGLLLFMGLGAIFLSMVFVVNGTGPLMVAGLVALLVALITWLNSRKATRVQSPTTRQE